VLLLVRHGGRVDDEVSRFLSMALSALLVGHVSAGVVRARRVRIVLGGPHWRTTRVSVNVG
jgi:hypothetical protein